MAGLAGLLGSGSSGNSTQRNIIFALVVMIFLPTGLTVWTSLGDSGLDDTTNDALNGFYEFAGNKPTKEAVWVLKSIATSYNGGIRYGYSPDGWLYGDIVGEGDQSYTPSQYIGTRHEYSVSRDSEGIYRYTEDTPNGDHKQGDLYTDVTMDVRQQSHVFFTEAGKHTSGDWFYYNFDGYRYAFGPLSPYKAVDNEGNSIPVSPTDTSLSLIWYNYYGSTGISGQLIIAGGDKGVAYLDAASIVRAFDQTTTTARFEMTFNNVNVNVYIRLNPYYLAQLASIEECYNQGYWEVQITSDSVDANAYMSTDFDFNPTDIVMTALKLFSFNMADLGVTGWTGIILSIVFCLPLYSGFLTLGLEHYWLLAIFSIVGILQGLTHVWPF